MTERQTGNLQSRTIEYLRFVCAFSVVMIHSFGPPMDGSRTATYTNGIYDTIRIIFSQGLCRVAVPMFFFISGFLFFKKLVVWDKSVWAGKIRRRIKTLAVPYIIWNIIALPFILLTEYVKFRAHGSVEPIDQKFLTFGHYATIFWNFSDGYPISGALWYVRDLIVLCLLSPVIHFFVTKCRSLGLVLFFVLYMACPADYLFAGLRLTGLFLFTFGAYVSVRKKDFVELFSRTSVLRVSSILSLIFLTGMALSYGNHPWEYFYLRKAYSVSGVIAISGFISRGLSAGVLKDHPLLSESSFFVYAIHGPIILRPLKGIIHYLFPADTQLLCTVEYFVIFVLAILIIELIYIVLRKLAPQILVILGTRIH